MSLPFTRPAMSGGGGGWIDPLAGINFYIRAQSNIGTPLNTTEPYLSLSDSGAREVNTKYYWDDETQRFTTRFDGLQIAFEEGFWRIRNPGWVDYYEAAGSGDASELNTLTWDTIGGQLPPPNFVYGTETDRIAPVGMYDFDLDHITSQGLAKVREWRDDLSGTPRVLSNPNVGSQRRLAWRNGVPELATGYFETLSMPSSVHNIYEAILTTFSGTEKYQFSHGPVGSALSAVQSWHLSPALLAITDTAFSPEEEAKIRAEGARISPYAQPSANEILRCRAVTSGSRSFVLQGSTHGITYDHSSRAEYVAANTQGVSLALDDYLIIRIANRAGLTSIQQTSGGLAGFAPNFSDCTTLATINLSNQRFVGDLVSKLTNVPALTSLTAATCSLTGTVDFSTLTALTTVNLNGNRYHGFQGSVPPTLGNANFSNNYFTQAAVDACLQAFVDAGRSTGTRVLNLGGTALNMAVPSSAGLANKTILQGRGWTVTTR